MDWFFLSDDGGIPCRGRFETRVEKIRIEAGEERKERRGQRAEMRKWTSPVGDRLVPQERERNEWGPANSFWERRIDLCSGWS